MKEVNKVNKQLYLNTNEIFTYHRTMQHDIRQGNIIIISSVDDTRHSHSQNSTFFLKSGDTVNAQLHNATLPPP